jgi:hypothetical protein
LAGAELAVVKGKFIQTILTYLSKSGLADKSLLYCSKRWREEPPPLADSRRGRVFRMDSFWNFRIYKEWLSKRRPKKAADPAGGSLKGGWFRPNSVSF